MSAPSADLTVKFDICIIKNLRMVNFATLSRRYNVESRLLLIICLDDCIINRLLSARWERLIIFLSMIFENVTIKVSKRQLIIE